MHFICRWHFTARLSSYIAYCFEHANYLDRKMGYNHSNKQKASPFPTPPPLILVCLRFTELMTVKGFVELGFQSSFL